MSLKLTIIYKGINEFKKGYQPRNNITNDENPNLSTNPQNILNRWKNFFNQLLNVHAVHDVRQMDINTVEPLVPEPSLAEVEIAIRNLKSYKSSCTDHIPSELIKSGGETLHSEIHRLICCIWNKDELPQRWKESIIVPIYKKGDKTDCNNYRGISLLSTAYKSFSNIFCPDYLHMSMKLLGIISVGSVVTDLLLITFYIFGRY
jgi:hypothetical protein